jgi:hypothetical protein
VCVYKHTHYEKVGAVKTHMLLCLSSTQTHTHTHTHTHILSPGTIAFDFHRGSHTRNIEQKMSKTITFKRVRRPAWEREEEVLEEATAQEKRRAATA